MIKVVLKDTRTGEELETPINAELVASVTGVNLERW